MDAINYNWRCLLLLHCLAFAMAPLTLHAFGSVEFSVAAGPNWPHANSTTIVISPLETDSVRTSNVTNDIIWKVGAGLHVFEEKLNQRPFINDLLLELNLYRSSETVKGNVWQYQLPQFNNYSFHAPFTSTRLMLEVKPSLFSWYHISPYPILGVGMGRNSLSYHESVTDSDVDPNSAHYLSHKTTTNFVYDLGLGARVEWTKCLFVSLEYVYTNLGKASPSGTPTNNVAMTSAPRFKMVSQAALLGLNWKI